MAKSDLHLIPTSNLPYNKAGVVLKGLKTEDIGKPDAKTYVVAPYTEGRFGDNEKYYVLAKGSIDPRETILDAALREFTEETGIDMVKLLGRSALATLQSGQAVQNVESKGYEGIRVKSFAPMALDFAYEGREGKNQRTAIFTIELEGIEKLKPYLKNPTNENRSDRIMSVDHPVRSLLHPLHAHDQINYPSFRDRLAWLREMKMPDKPWSGNKGGEALLLTRSDGTAVPQDWFTQLEEKFLKTYQYPSIETADDWRNFLQQQTPEDCQLIYQAAEQMKEALLELGILKGDCSTIKFDTKDTPLFFYQEGADIISAESWLESCIRNSARRKDFALAFCGNTPSMDARAASPIERIGRSQLAGVVWAASNQDIAKAVESIKAEPLRTTGLLWGVAAARYLNGALKRNLTTVHDQMEKQNNVPLAEVVSVVPKGRARMDGSFRLAVGS